MYAVQQRRRARHVNNCIKGEAPLHRFKLYYVTVTVSFKMVKTPFEKNIFKELTIPVMISGNAALVVPIVQNQSYFKKSPDEFFQISKTCIKIGPVLLEKLLTPSRTH